MEEKMRNKVMMMLAVAAVLFFIAALASFNSSLKERKNKDKEMATRMDAEEKLSKFMHEEVSQADKIKKLQQDLDTANEELTSVRKTLAQEQLINNSLKEEIQKLTKHSEVLEEKLKEQAAAAKSVPAKK